MLTLAGWLSRHAARALVSLVVIVLILIAGSVAVPWAKAEWRASRTLSTQASTLAAARARIVGLEQRIPDQAELARLGDDTLTERRQSIARAHGAAEAQRLSKAQLLLAAGAGETDRIVAHGRAGVELAALDAETAALDAVAAQRDAARGLAAARASVAEVRRLRGEEAAAQVPGPLSALCSVTPTLSICEPVRRLEQVRARRGEAERRLVAQGAALNRQQALARARDTAEQRLAEARAALTRETAALDAQATTLKSQVRDNWWEWVSNPVRDVLPQALLILLGVILAPPAIKAFLYFIVAPAAGRRAPIRLLPGAKGVESAGHVSAVTLALPLTPGAELLVRPDFLQSSPDSATKRTRWLFDWSMPLTSLAAGLVGLTAVRGTDGRTVAVSAKGDPLAEVGRVDLPTDGAFVLQPRALIGLMQDAGAPMRLTRHWRLGVTAWLTLQLRYLVIHGPGVVIVAGTRGVRLEEAGAGRVSDQAGTLGFDAALDYSVTRSETFGAYLMGHAELFDDRFRGEGRYLYEEMPKGRGGSIWGRGLEGLSDAVLKVFGV